MVIRNLCWSLGLFAAVCGACSSDPGAGNGYIDLPSVAPSGHGGGSGSGSGSGAASGVSGSTSIAGTSLTDAVQLSASFQTVRQLFGDNVSARNNRIEFGSHFFF